MQEIVGKGHHVSHKNYLFKSKKYCSLFKISYLQQGFCVFVRQVIIDFLTFLSLTLATNRVNRFSNISIVIGWEISCRYLAELLTMCSLRVFSRTFDNNMDFLGSLIGSYIRLGKILPWLCLQATFTWSLRGFSYCPFIPAITMVSQRHSS